MTCGLRRFLSYFLTAGLVFSTAFGPSPALAQSSCDNATGACTAMNIDSFCTQQYINDFALCYYCQSLANQIAGRIQQCDGYSVSGLTDPSVNWDFPPTFSNATATSITSADITGSVTGTGMTSSTAVQSQTSTNLSSQLSVGVIVGIAIGALALIVIFGLLIWACQRREPRPSSQPQPRVQQTGQRQQPIVTTRQQTVTQTRAAPVYPVYTGNAAPVGNGGATGDGVIRNDPGQQPVIAVYNAAPPPYNSSMKSQFWQRLAKDS